MLYNFLGNATNFNMILIYGQPASGKTTLAQAIIKKLNESHGGFNWCISIDGDVWREIIDNKVYDLEGRKRNLKSAFDLAVNLESQGFMPVLSFVCPYEIMRSYLREKSNLVEIYLKHYEDRGRQQFAVQEFEEPCISVLNLNTTFDSIDVCVNKAIDYIRTKLMHPQTQ